MYTLKVKGYQEHITAHNNETSFNNYLELEQEFFKLVDYLSNEDPKILYKEFKESGAVEVGDYIISMEEKEEEPACNGICKELYSEFNWMTSTDIKSGKRIYLMPHFKIGNTLIRVNYCPSCGKYIRDIELNNKFELNEI